MDPEKLDQVSSNLGEDNDNTDTKDEALQVKDSKGAGDRLSHHRPRFSPEEEAAVIRKLD
jgi:hypothetical protein